MPHKLSLWALALLCLASCHDASPVPQSASNFSVSLDSLRALLAQVDQTAQVDSQIALLTPLLATAAIPDDTLRRDTLAEAYRRLGAAHYDKEDYATARHYHRAGLRLQPRGELPSRLHCNVGLSYFREANYRRSIASLDSARHAGQHNPSSYHYFIATFYTGVNYQALGEYRFAESYYRQALAIAPQLDSYAEYWEQQSYCSLSDVQRRRGDLASAIEQARTGLAALTYPNSMQAGNLHLNVGNAWQDSLERLAVTHTDLRQSTGDSALWHTRRALEIFRTAQEEEAEVTAAQNLGELYRRLGKYAESRQTLTKYIKRSWQDTAQVLRNNRLAGKLYLNRGEARRDAGDPTGAAADFKRAIDRLVPQRSMPSDQLIPDLTGPVADPAALLIALQDLAEWHQDNASDPREGISSALEIYDSALVVTDRIRADFSTTEDKIALAQRTRPLVDASLSGYRRLNQLTGGTDYGEQAFQLTERRKAIVLLSNLHLDQSLREVGEGFRQRVKALQKAQAELNEAIYTAAVGSTERQRYLRAWADTTAQLRTLQQELVNSLPNLNLLVDQRHLLGITELQQEVLDSDQGILSYHYEPGTLHVFLLTPKQLHWQSVDLLPTFAQDVDTLQWLLNTPRSHSNLRDRQQLYCATAYRLSQQLLPDFGVALPERLIIVPDIPFLDLPFEALWTEPTPGGFTRNSSADGFLLSRHAISYAYSANLLATMRRSLPSATGKRPGRLAGFAAHFPDRLTAGKQSLAQPVAAALPYLTALPGQREIERIANSVATQEHAAEAATREQFLEACENFTAVHMITHGILNEANPLFNFISFSQMADTVDTDQLLFLEDFYATGLNVDMVSLSACQTARGKPVTDEGPMSLSRGLAAAGVRSVVTQLWRISIDDTNDLMPLFYQQFTRPGGQDRDRALAEAKRAFIKKSANNRDPSFWAAGILIGHAGPLELEPARIKASPAWWAVAGGIVLLLIGFFRRRSVRVGGQRIPAH